MALTDKSNSKTHNETVRYKTARTDLVVIEEDLVLATLVILQTLFVEGPIKTGLQS